MNDRKGRRKRLGGIIMPGNEGKPMATRPVYIPDREPGSPQLIHAEDVDFQWIPGRSAEIWKANTVKLHAAAAYRKLEPLLEVTAAADDPLGTRIQPESLTLKDDRSYMVSVTAVYHGSKVFATGGPYTDLYRQSERDILADARLENSGALVGYRFGGLEWGLKAGTMFFDWLVVHALHRQREWRRLLVDFKGFTAVGCRSGDQTVCHARSCALYVALVEKDLVDEVLTVGNHADGPRLLVRMQRENHPDFEQARRLLLANEGNRIGENGQ
jgi:hypothetical protein